MKTLRQVRDELAEQLLEALKAGDFERLQQLVVDAQTRIAACTDEEFEYLRTDVPKSWDS